MRALFVVALALVAGCQCQPEEAICIPEVCSSHCCRENICEPAEVCLASVGIDAGVVDAGLIASDAGDIDAGDIDAGGIDAGGSLIDAGVTDAGPRDAGTIDAGLQDAGTFDAGTIDAGVTDAGTWFRGDGGYFPDSYCDAAGWCLEYPATGPTFVTGLSLSSATQGWLTDLYTHLWRWDGEAWRLSSPLPQTNRSWHSSFMLDANHLILGGVGELVFFDGTTYQTRSNNTGYWVSDVWAASLTDVWMLAGPVWRFDGTTFTQFPLANYTALEDVWGNNAADVWLVGNRFAYHVTSAGTTEPAVPATADLHAVRGRSATDVVLAGNTALRWNGTAFTDLNLPAGAIVRGLAVTPTEYWAVGDNGFIASWSPSTGWTVYPSAVNANWTFVAAAGTEVWVTSEGQYAHRTATGFEVVNPRLSNVTRANWSPDLRASLLWGWRTSSPLMVWEGGGVRTLDAGLGVQVESACLSSGTSGMLVTTDQHLRRIVGNTVVDLGPAGLITDIACSPSGDAWFITNYRSAVQRQRGTSPAQSIGLVASRLQATPSAAVWMMVSDGGPSTWVATRDGGVEVNSGPWFYENGYPPKWATSDSSLYRYSGWYLTEFHLDGGSRVRELGFGNVDVAGSPLPVDDRIMAVNFQSIVEISVDGGYRFTGTQADQLACTSGRCRAIGRGIQWRRDYP